MSHTIRRTLAAGAVAVIGLTGAVAPASAETAPDCDPTVVAAALVTATTDARAAQEAYTTYTKTSMKTLVKKAAKSPSRAQLRATIKAERARLKTVWTVAKVELQRVRAHAEACAAAEGTDPDDRDPVT